MSLQLVYDENDHELMRSRCSRTLYWLDDLGAIPLHESTTDTEGYLFSCAVDKDYTKLVSSRPMLRDRPDERQPLTQLDLTLDKLLDASIDVPMPQTWRIDVDDPLPGDITFPLFLRTARSSWKLGGDISRVNNECEFAAESRELRRAFAWDARILAREWIDFSTAGESMYGAVPQEVRVWCVDARPLAWSFHFMHVVPSPAGFPISNNDQCALHDYAARICKVFHSRLMVCDFARRRDDQWVFLEAGPGSAAGTGHEQVFKFVASALIGKDYPMSTDRCGGHLDLN